MNDVAQRTDNPLVVLKDQITRREPEFRAALPAHIPVERFSRVIMTAVQMNQDLVQADRRSFFNSAMKAAQDGLLPDGREGAIVIYNTKVKGENGERDYWAKMAQWMPMIAGLRKKVRNSGEIITWDAQVVYAGDQFDYELGDDPFIRHKPALIDRGAPIAAYSIAKLKDGTLSREVMPIAEIEGVRARSKAKDSGPWKTDYAEMCRKTVARRHSKVLPMSTDLDDLIRRDDDLYDFKGAADDNAQPASAKITNLSDRLGALVRPTAPADDLPPSDGPLIEHEAPNHDDGRNTSEPADAPPYHSHGEAAGDGSSASPAADRQAHPVSIAWEHGVAAKADGRQRRDIPSEYRDGSREHERRAWLAGFEGRPIPEAE